MLSPRLTLERDAILATLAKTSRAVLGHASDDGLSYEILFQVRTLVRGDDRVIREEERVVPVAYELSPRHPLVAPLAIALQRDLFHPNLRDPRQPLPLPPVPIVCLGTFRAAQNRLADWVVATYYLLAFQRFTSGHGLNPEAVVFARREAGRGRFPTDRRDFWDAPRSPR